MGWTDLKLELLEFHSRSATGTGVTSPTIPKCERVHGQAEEVVHSLGFKELDGGVAQPSDLLQGISHRPLPLAHEFQPNPVDSGDRSCANPPEVCFILSSTFATSK